MNWYTQFSSSTRSGSNRGSVVTEFAIVLPLLLVFFVGISGLGQLLNHVTWISQTTYAAAMFAADIPAQAGPAKVETETERLASLQSRGQVTGDWSPPVYFEGQITGKPIVSVTVPTAHVSPFLRTFFTTDVSVSVAAPYLVPNQTAFAGFNDFGNPPGAGCVGFQCNPPSPPYNPPKKILEVTRYDGAYGGLGDFQLKDDGAQALVDDFAAGLEGGASFEELMEKYGESEYFSNPDVVSAINTLGSIDSKLSTGSTGSALAD